MVHSPLLRAFGLSLVVTFASASPATAQRLPEPWADAEDQPGRVDVSVSFGRLAPTDWSDLVLLGSLSSATGALEQVLVRDLRVDADNQVDAAVTYWRGRYGFRVQAGLSQSSLVVGGPLGTRPFSSSDSRIDVDTWSYDMRGVFGLLEYEPRRWVWPYAFFGLGGITYDLEHTISPPLLTFIERPSPTGRQTDIVVVDDENPNFVVAVDELGTETVFSVSFGVGTDFRIPLGPAGVGLRLEVSDQMAESPVNLRIEELRRVGTLTTDTGVHFGAVHHFRAAIGFVVQIGR